MTDRAMSKMDRIAYEMTLLTEHRQLLLGSFSPIFDDTIIPPRITQYKFHGSGKRYSWRQSALRRHLTSDQELGAEISPPQANVNVYTSPKLNQDIDTFVTSEQGALFPRHQANEDDVDPVLYDDDADLGHSHPKGSQIEESALFDNFVPPIYHNEGLSRSSFSKAKKGKARMVEETREHHAVGKPTCSLNLVCYRTGAAGCKLKQVHVVKKSGFKNIETFRAVLKKYPQLISTDRRFLQTLRDTYRKEMCGFWRRMLSFKTLRELRLLVVSIK
jgi:hypothetical protein